MSRHLEQLDRIRRYYNRFKRINDGGEFDRTVEDLLDDIHGFFQNCYHFKDWLKNDSGFTKHTGQQIEQYVTKILELAICADICNSTKHLQLTSPPRSGTLPALGRKSITIDIADVISTDAKSAEEVPQMISMKVEIMHNETVFDAFDVARLALQAWENFLKTP